MRSSVVAALIGVAGMSCAEPSREMGASGAPSGSGTPTGTGGDFESTGSGPGAGPTSGDVSGATTSETAPKFDLGGESDCSNLECDQVECADPTVTTVVTGTVYDPSGTLPLPNIQVYIPNAAVDPIPDTLTCDQCSAELSGSPLVAAVSDSQGRFTLENVPAGVEIPLVLQAGKWRRQVTMPAVEACQTHDLADPALLRLPRSRAEGNLPRIALSTGDSDPLFCLLRRFGLDAGEYGVAGSDARVHFFRGSTGATHLDPGFGASPGAAFPAAPETLWQGGWQNYDLVLMSCEGAALNAAKNGLRVGLRDYLDAGGRAFATHYHYSWMQGDAPADLASVARFEGDLDGTNLPVQIDTSFAKGKSLADWLAFVDGRSPWGEFIVSEQRNNTQSISADAQRWVMYGAQEQIMVFSFNTPIGSAEDQQCGRMVYSDVHISNAAGNPTGNFPSACNDSALTEQEKLLLFMLFDLSACIEPDVPAG